MQLFCHLIVTKKERGSNGVSGMLVIQRASFKAKSLNLSFFATT